MKPKSHKNILIILMLVILFYSLGLLFFGCNSNYKQNQLNSQQIKPQNVIVIIYDISKSGDTYSFINSAHLEKLYTKIGEIGGGKCYFLFIQSYSLKQEPIQASVPVLETLPLQGNGFQLANRKRINKNRIKNFNEQKSEFLSISSSIIQPKEADFSDVENALILAKQILENPDYKTWNRYLIICSDLENDFPPKHGIDEMNKVEFQNDVRIAAVRVSRKINLQEVLPGSVKYVTINDAIESIFNKRNI